MGTVGSLTGGKAAWNMNLTTISISWHDEKSVDFTFSPQRQEIVNQTPPKQTDALKGIPRFGN
jgi:hypothetical protein